jgi:uncharacterized membrane protein YqjE
MRRMDGGRMIGIILAILGNRINLILAEAREERDRILHLLALALAMAVLAGLAGASLIAIVTIALWNHEPILVLASTAILSIAALVIARRRFRRWASKGELFRATADQVRKDMALLGEDRT